MTDKQELFSIEYMKDFNATQAAKRAGYSEKTAYSIGYELLKKPEIRKRMQELIDNEIGVTEKIVAQNIRFWEKMRDDKELNENARLKASEMLGRYKAMFIDKTELDVSGNISNETLTPEERKKEIEKLEKKLGRK